MRAIELAERHNECGRKRAYTRSRALRAARMHKMRAYPCTFCEQWHLTSKPKREP